MNFPFKLRSTSEFDVVGFGTNAVDYLIRLPDYPQFNSKVEFTSQSMQAGGEVASTLVGLQRLGLRTAYAGRFGSDANGKIGMQSLIDEGVDTRFTETVEDAETQVAFVIIDEGSGERTILWKRDERLGFSKDEAPLAAASLGKILHLTPHDTDAAIIIAAEAKKDGIVVTIDIDNIFDNVDNLLPLVDVVIASSDLPKKMTGLDDERASINKLAETFGCALVGVTLGTRGSLFIADGEFIETPAFAVPGGCIDTTGAGDAFRTGFLFGMLVGETIEKAAVYANAVAALKCRAIGARTALPTKPELEEFIANT
ncbi:MAG: PfkB family carbohydrate kinase [Pyrinomonadaceae bacterium]